jgi:serine protease
MIRIPSLRKNGRVFLAIATLSCASLSLAVAQAQQSFPPGEVMLYCKPGTPQAKVQELANSIGAERVEALRLKDCYRLWLPADKRTNDATTAAVAQLKTKTDVRYVRPFYFYKRQQTSGSVEPNDPRYRSNEQWNLKMIRMPQAWAITKGGTNANMAIIDSGFNPAHEDLQGTYHSASTDLADNDGDITADGSGTAAEAHHGTFGGGIMNAKTNNAVGIAGIAWTNMQLVAVKVERSGTNALDPAAITNAFTYIGEKAGEARIKSLNISLGRPGDANAVDDPDYVALKQASDAGVLIVAAAGNESSSSGQVFPANLPFVMSVAAVRPSGQPASYTNFGKIDIAAPGGELSEGEANGVLSTLNGTNVYAFEQGTSFAAPHVTGVAGLMMSIPGVNASFARAALQETANRRNITGALPDSRLGYGVLDAGAALARVSVRIEIQDPIGLDALGNTTDPTGVPRPVETLRPTLRFAVNRVPISANDVANNLVVTIDGQTISKSELLAAVETGVTTGTDANYVIALRLPKSLARVGEHTLVVQGTNPVTGTTAREERRFTITPHEIPSGVSMISIPYYESPSDSPTGTFREAQALLGQDITLYRWIYLPGQVVNGVVQSGGKYAQISPAGSDLPDNAKFRPVDAQTTPSDNTSEVISPVGLAYFIKTNATTPVLTYGVDYSRRAVRIPIHEGWNMIGDPYPYPTSFNTVIVEDRTGTRYTAQEAADNGIILPYIYRFVGGQYEFQSLPNGILAPWEGHWIYVVPKSGTPNPANKMTLVVQPVQSGTVTRSAASGSRAITTAPRTTGSGSWILKLEARTDKGLVDTSNFVGTTTRAASSNLNSVPKPPKPSPFVSLGITKPDAPNGIGLYAQDLQPTGGNKTWDVVVNSDQPESEVTISWPEIKSVPRNVRLTLTDKATGQTIDLRRQSSFRFNTGRSVEPRSLTLTAKPSAIAGRALITNLMVNPVRPANGRSAPIYEINYSLNQDVRVEMSILSASGKMMANVGNTRAAAIGDNRAVWNGRDNAGRDLPAGMYVLQVRAITPDGEITRSVTSFLMTR